MAGEILPAVAHAHISGACTTENIALAFIDGRQRQTERTLLGPEHASMPIVRHGRFVVVAAAAKMRGEQHVRPQSGIAFEVELDQQHVALRIRRDAQRQREARMAMHAAHRRDSPFISETSIFRFRDIYDHLVKFVEIIEVCRELISSLLEIHLSLVNNELARLGNRTNQVVRRLTFITTIFMPLSFFAGVGGMSEWSMMTGPENWRIAYPAFLAGMGVVGVISYFILRWLDRRGTGQER